MRLDLDTPPGVLTTFRVTDSVEWGHIGSRLATGVELGFENKSLYHNPEPFAATAYCTSDRGAAWVILGWARYAGAEAAWRPPPRPSWSLLCAAAAAAAVPSRSA